MSIKINSINYYPVKHDLNSDYKFYFPVMENPDFYLSNKSYKSLFPSANIVLYYCNMPGTCSVSVDENGVLSTIGDTARLPNFGGQVENPDGPFNRTISFAYNTRNTTKYSLGSTFYQTCIDSNVSVINGSASEGICPYIRINLPAIKVSVYNNCGKTVTGLSVESGIVFSYTVDRGSRNNYPSTFLPYKKSSDTIWIHSSRASWDNSRYIGTNANISGNSGKLYVSPAEGIQTIITDVDNSYDVHYPVLYVQNTESMGTSMTYIIRNQYIGFSLKY